MIRKLVCAMVVMTLTIGVVAAADFNVLITKVDDGKITFFKTKKGQKDGDAMTLPAAKDVKVNYGTQKKGKVELGDEVKGGLKADVFSKIGDKGIQAHVTTDADDKNITAVVLTGKK